MEGIYKVEDTARKSLDIGLQMLTTLEKWMSNRIECGRNYQQQ